MSHDGPTFYDDAQVFDRYARLRERAESANDTLEAPVIKALIGAVDGLDVLDLGCGDGLYGRELLAAGARSYLGIDGSMNMVRAAQASLAGTKGRVQRGDLACGVPAEPASFDLAISRLALHYVADIGPVLRGIHAALRPGGRLVFSTEHPVITCSNQALADDGLRQDWIVDDYFVPGRRVVAWLGAEVAMHHRTIEEWFAAVQGAGFVVTALRESKPQRERFADPALFERRGRIPLFLFIAARKPL
ncbi:MAG TPA: methyltransferase domain-containing protein [Burkholderiaceae bacterium]|nr:methyltransferase domain-containing protein [Burkholderiaceae bacterium]